MYIDQEFHTIWLIIGTSKIEYLSCSHESQGLIFLKGKTIVVIIIEAHSNYFYSYAIPLELVQS